MNQLCTAQQAEYAPLNQATFTQQAKHVALKAKLKLYQATDGCILHFQGPEHHLRKIGSFDRFTYGDIIYTSNCWVARQALYQVKCVED